MEWIIITGICASLAAAALFLANGRQQKKSAPAAISLLKESRSMLLLVALLWGNAAFLFYAFQKAAQNMAAGTKLYFLVLILADILLGSFTLLYMLNRMTAATEEGVMEITAFGCKKFIPWNEVQEIRPPNLTHLTYVFVGFDGTVIPISGARETKEKFVRESAKMLPKNLKTVLMDSLTKKLR